MYKLIRPLLFKFDPESMHAKALALAAFLQNIGAQYLFAPFFRFEHTALQSRVFGIQFKNPLGFAAGVDRNAEALKFLTALGVGHIETGNVTAQGRLGNPKPRLFRLENDRALINRIGLNNYGADVLAKKLQLLKFAVPVGINIAKTHDPNILGDKAVADFVYSFKKLYGIGSYITLNISCPNTVEGITFEEPAALNTLLSEIKKTAATFPIQRPILVKISPDINFDQLEKILEVCESHQIDGYVLTNTAKFRDGLKTDKSILGQIGKGGLSGPPIRQKSTELVRRAYQYLKRPCIIGLGGIDSAETAYEKIKAGASLVQVYTGLVYEGPGLVKKINQGLVKLLQRDGFKNISEAVGVEG